MMSDKIFAQPCYYASLASEIPAGDIVKNRGVRYRTRYVTDSGIIGSKEFVSTHYQRFKTLFNTKHAKKPKPIKGLEGIYSLKRLSESI